MIITKIFYSLLLEMSYTKIKPLKDRVYLHKSLKECLKIFNIKSRETVEVPCPFCLSEEKKFFFKIDDLSYFHCKKWRLLCVQGGGL